MGPLMSLLSACHQVEEVCWKCNCKPIVYMERRQSTLLKMRHPENSHQCFYKCILKLDTKSFESMTFLVIVTHR